jgi:RNA polymerase sigma-70 factor (ECF subfamily)
MPRQEPAAQNGIPTTDWSELRRAGSGDAFSPQALERVLQLYRPLLLDYVRRRWRVDEGRAEDLVQDFIVRRMLEHDLAGRADRTRGRFRSFLLTALSNHVMNCLRDEQKRKLGASMSPDQLEAAQDCHCKDPHQGFEMAWARQVLEQTLSCMRDECIRSARPHLWSLFEARVSCPALSGDPPVPYSQLVKQLAFTDTREAMNALVTAKRMFIRHLEATLEAYAPDQSRSEAMCDLRKILSHFGAGSPGPAVNKDERATGAEPW